MKHTNKNTDADLMMSQRESIYDSLLIKLQKQVKKIKAIKSDKKQVLEYLKMIEEFKPKFASIDFQMRRTRSGFTITDLAAKREEQAIIKKMMEEMSKSKDGTVSISPTGGIKAVNKKRLGGKAKNAK